MNAYRKAIERSPKRATGYWRLAVLYDRQGRLHDSDGLYKQALERDRKNSDIHGDYGYSLYLQRRWAEAEDHLRQAVAGKSGNLRAHNHLGLLLAQTDRTDEARTEFHRAGCSEADTHVNLAFAAMMNQNWGKAREEYHLALQTNPDSVAARTGVEKLEGLVAKTNSDSGTFSVAGGFRDPGADALRPAADGVSTAAWIAPGSVAIPSVDRAD